MSDVTVVTSTEHRGLLAPLLTAKGGRFEKTLLGPNRNFNLAIGRAKLRGSAKVAFSVADSEIRWAELVTRTVLTLSVQNGPACSKSALEKLGPIWPLGSIWLFSFYSASKLLQPGKINAQFLTFGLKYLANLPALFS